MMNSSIRRAIRMLYFKGFLHYCKKPVLRLGSEYGGWCVPEGFINEKSVCYLAGADQDISFDIEIASKYNAEVHIFDASPKSIAHFKDLEAHVNASKSMLFKDGRYCISREKFKRITFHQMAFWLHTKENHLAATMQQLSHSSIDLLKLDINGAEYKLLDALIADNTDVKVLCVRFYELHKPLDFGFLNRVRKQIKQLINAGYTIVCVDHVYNITFVKK